MKPVAGDEGWEQRMAERARRQRPPESPINRDNWPGPPELRGASARDAFLWYIADAWPKFFGEDEPVETVFDHDFGCHVLRKGSWQLKLIDLEQFPDQAESPNDLTDDDSGSAKISRTVEEEGLPY